MVDITSMVNTYRRYEDSIRAVTESSIRDDLRYRKLVKNIKDTEKFNYHSDYWGCAEQYQEDNVDFMRALKPFINKKVILDNTPCKIIGLLIDRHYNSLSHSAIMVETI